MQLLSCTSYSYKIHQSREKPPWYRGGRTPPQHNHSLRINAFAKTSPLLPSHTRRSLLCCRDSAGNCDTNQCFVPDIGSMEMLQTQTLALPTATWEFLLRSVFTNAIHSLTDSKGVGKIHPNFILYLLGKLWVTAEAAAAPTGGTQKWPSCTTHLPAGQGEAKGRPWPRFGSTRGSAIPLTFSEKSNLNHRATGLWLTTQQQVCCCPGRLQAAGSPLSWRKA